MLKAAIQTYDKKAKDIGDLEIRVDTLTVDAYLNFEKKNLLVAVRGTKPTEIQDLIADIKISLGGLKSSSRFHRDSKVFSRILQRYPPEIFKYYITGHSLGGAIVNLFMKQYPFIKRAETFNSAAQRKDFGDPDVENRVFKWYIDKDPLYRMMGWRFKNKNIKKVLPFQRRFKSFLDFFKPTIFKIHGLQNFHNRIKESPPFQF